MELEGSCHCGGVRFTLRSAHPYPFNLCYCSLCCKTAGGGGYAINLGGDYSTLQVHGEENITAIVTGQIVVNPQGSVFVMTKADPEDIGISVCQKCEEEHG